MLSLLFPLGLAACAPIAARADVPPMLPLFYRYGGYPKIITDIMWGTPPQVAVETIVDLGSGAFGFDHVFFHGSTLLTEGQVFGPNSTINSGSPYLGGGGPCNQEPTPYYNWPESSSATEPIDEAAQYSYGGNGKIVSGYYSINDTISFANGKYPSFANQRVEIVNYTVVRSTTCVGDQYERSILGLCSTSSSPFRQDLLDLGMIETAALSMWFDAPPADVTGDFQGTAIFGAVPKGKYSGDLVRVAPNPPEGGSSNYYVSTPIFETSPVNNTSAKKTLEVNTTDTPQCLLDSGTGTEILPFSSDDFYDLTGLIEFNGYPAFNGTCESLPSDATLDYTFAGVGNKSVTVKIPLRSYARGITDAFNNTDVCGLSFSLHSTGSCVLGAPFFTAAFLAFDDETNQIAIAQGGASSNAADGADGLGELTIIKKGEGLPTVN